MDYFDGIKVGDKVYTAMGTPLMVCEVAMKCFDAKSYDSEEGRQIAFNFDGRLLDYEQLGQVVFWKPPPRFDPPPRPKRKVKRERSNMPCTVVIHGDRIGFFTSNVTYWLGPAQFIDGSAHVEWEVEE